MVFERYCNASQNQNSYLTSLWNYEIHISGNMSRVWVAHIFTDEQFSKKQVINVQLISLSFEVLHNCQHSYPVPWILSTLVEEKAST